MLVASGIFWLVDVSELVLPVPPYQMVGSVAKAVGNEHFSKVLADLSAMSHFICQLV